MQCYLNWCSCFVVISGESGDKKVIKICQSSNQSTNHCPSTEGWPRQGQVGGADQLGLPTGTRKAPAPPGRLPQLQTDTWQYEGEVSWSLTMALTCILTVTYASHRLHCSVNVDQLPLFDSHLTY